MKDFIKVMKAQSDPNRVKILKLLQQKTMCVCELRGALQIAQPSVSRHLKLLEETGFVDHKKEGLWVNYYLADGRAIGAIVFAILLGFLMAVIFHKEDMARDRHSQRLSVRWWKCRCSSAW